MSYAEDLKIDKYALDEEWEKQASLYHAYALKHADSMLKRDRLKEKLDYTAADLNFKIRTDPGSYGIEGRPTEAAINVAVSLVPEHGAASELYLKAKHETEIIFGVRVALEHKKKALGYITDMYIHGLLGERASVPDVVRRMTEERLVEHHEEALNQNSRLRRLSKKREEIAPEKF